MENQIVSKPLDVMELDLRGCYVIEASAGTGKTYNITRLFIRTLLEKKVDVRQVLIVTFTKAATEELKGRIASELSELVEQLSDSSDSLPQDYAHLIDGLHFHSASQGQLADNKAYQREQARLILKSALLDLDEASIYTIHSFCQRVLKHASFQQQAPFNPELVDTKPQIFQTVQDWFRQKQHDSSIQAVLVDLNCTTPEKFYTFFKPVLEGRETLSLTTDGFDDLHAVQENVLEFNQAISVWYKKSQSLIKQTESILLEHKSVIEEVLQTQKSKHPKAFEHFQILIKFLSKPTSDSIITNIEYKHLFSEKALNAYFKTYPNKKTVVETINLFKEKYTELLDANKQNFESIKNCSKKNKSLQDKASHVLKIYPELQKIRKQIKAQKDKLSIFDYNDIIYDLAHSIEQGNEAVIEYIRMNYPIALIDEFQDTDSAQFSIFSACYIKHPKQLDSLFVMIGDPKQAIYAFRGGDIDTYLLAKKMVADRAPENIKSMQHNYRSSAEMIEAYNWLFYGAPSPESEDANLFSKHIEYPWVYRGDRPLPEFNDDLKGALQFWPTSFEEKGKVTDVRIAKSKRVAAEILRLINTAKIGEEKINFKDIAILVPGKTEGLLVKQALYDANIRCVFLSDRSNIFDSVQASALYDALEAILNPQDNVKFYRALSTDLFGYTPDEIKEVDSSSASFDKAKILMHSLKQMWVQDGVLVVINKLVKNHFRFCAGIDSAERVLTNYLHLAEILHSKSKDIEQAHQLLIWLKTMLLQSADNTFLSQEDEQIIRLESDEDLVKIVTIHSSKGLEYPIVFIPFAGFQKPTKESINIVRHSERASNKTSLILGPNSKQIIQHEQKAQEEKIRLLYVAITRSIYRCYVGLGHKEYYAGSAIGKLLRHQGINDPVLDLGKLQTSAPDLFYVAYEDALVKNDFQSTNNGDSDNGSVPLGLSQFQGDTDEKWRLSSFSNLSRRVSVDLREKDRDDVAMSSLEAINHPQTQESIRFSIEKHSETGDFLHNLFEDHELNTLFDIDKENIHLKNYQNSNREVDISELNKWLNEVLRTPLLSEDKQLSLSMLKVDSYLKEPEFYFPLKSVSKNALERLMNQHRSDINPDCLASKFDVKELTGMMHGFIDLIFEYKDKYYVVDYKSNFLGNTSEHYQHSNMEAKITEHNYDLQYLIYSWALDKYLGARLANYNRDKHFGGVFYLFLRGMSPHFVRGSGVYHTQISLSTWQKMDATFSCDSQKVAF